MRNFFSKTSVAICAALVAQSVFAQAAVRRVDQDVATQSMVPKSTAADAAALVRRVDAQTATTPAVSAAADLRRFEVAQAGAANPGSPPAANTQSTPPTPSLQNTSTPPAVSPVTIPAPSGASSAAVPAAPPSAPATAAPSAPAQGQAPSKPARVNVSGSAVARDVQRVSPATPPTTNAPARALAGEPAPAAERDKRLPALKPDDPALKPFVLHTRIGVNEVVTISSRLLNRISTPFQEPVVVDTSGAQFKVVGSEVFLLPASDEPAGIYLFDKSNPTQVVSLTLVPQAAIPGQNILIKLEDLRALGNLALTSSASATLAAKPADYESMLTQILVSAVNGKIAGFNAVPLQTSVALIDEVEVEPDVVFQGGSYDVYRYRLRNTSDETIALNEGVFYREGVRAVTFFPRDTLAPQGKTYVFIVADKAKAPGATFQSEADQAVTGKKD